MLPNYKLYIRYFDSEILVDTPSEGVQFLQGLQDVPLPETLINSFVAYAESKTTFPKRFKVSPRCYFIVIKTTAKDMAEFKANGAGQASSDAVPEHEYTARPSFDKVEPGWYQATMNFRRVIPDENGKFQYADTEFVVKLKAHSIQDCYDRVVNHLRTREDVDPRSQFPSIKGRNFQASFLGFE